QRLSPCRRRHRLGAAGKALPAIQRRAARNCAGVWFGHPAVKASRPNRDGGRRGALFAPLGNCNLTFPMVGESALISLPVSSAIQHLTNCPYGEETSRWPKR